MNEKLCFDFRWDLYACSLIIMVESRISNLYCSIIVKLGLVIARDAGYVYRMPRGEATSSGGTRGSCKYDRGVTTLVSEHRLP